MKNLRYFFLRCLEECNKTLAKQPFFDTMRTDTYLRRRFATHIGSLSNDDGDVNENGKKLIGFDWQNNNFARASRFFVQFFAVTVRLQRENNFTFC